MPKDVAELAFQAHLAEFTALRAEIIETLKWREAVSITTIVLYSALFSFYFSGREAIATNEIYRVLALELVTPTCMVAAARFLIHSLHMHKLNRYISQVLAVKINAIVRQRGISCERAQHFSVLEWEGMIMQDNERAYRGLRNAPLVHRIVSLATFIAPGVAAQVIVFNATGGTWHQRFLTVELPILYGLNWVLLVAAAFLPVIRAINRRWIRKSSEWL